MVVMFGATVPDCHGGASMDAVLMPFPRVNLSCDAGNGVSRALDNIYHASRNIAATLLVGMTTEG